MNSIISDIVKNAIETKKYGVISELAKIEYPDKNDLIVTEYAGSGVRLYKDNKNRVRLLCPRDIDVYQENHVAEAIANGTIFDDADAVDNNAEMIEKTTIPYNAMINSGKCVPKKLKPMIAIVISKMDDDGSFDVSDIDRENGNKFVKAIVCCKDKGTDVPTVVGDYIEKDKEAFYTPEMGRDIVDLEKESDDIYDTNNEDVITDDDTVEDYGGKIPQSGDFDGYGDDVDLADHDKDPDDDEEESDDDNGDDNEDLDEDDDIKEIEEFFSNLIIEDVYQESKSTHYQRTMKKFDYDPKTQTVKTDIDMPDGKKLRAKLTIDDEFSQAIGPCVTYLVRRNPDGSIMYPDDPDKIVDKTKYEIHMRRRDLKQKGYRVAFALKHEEGHIANGHVEQLNGVEPIALIIPTAKDGKYKDAEAKSFLDGKDLSSVSEHDANPMEYTADKYAAEHTSKRTVDKALKNLYKNCQNLLLEQTGLYEDYVNAKKNIKMCKKKMKNLTEQDKKNIQKSIASLSKKISHLISEIQSVDMKIEGNKSEMLAMIDNIRQKNPNISKEELKKIVSTSELKKSLFKLNESSRRLNQELDITRQKREDLTKNDELLENAEMDLDLCKGVLDTFFNGMKLRQEYIKKFVKESYVEEPPMYETAYQEGFLSKKPKKLKPIPRDIIAYITVEMNDISSANDQAMLSGYTCSKLELVDFYLTVIDTQDPRYIVPHTKQYLETMKLELERLLAKILRIRPINKSDRIWRMNVTYPEGWRG